MKLASLGLMLFLLCPIRGSKPVQVLAFDYQETLDLVNALFTAVNPANSENTYMPQLLKDKITRLYDLRSREQLKFDFIGGFYRDYRGRQHQNVMMNASYGADNKPVIQIYAARLMTYAKMQLKLKPREISPLLKNTFAISLAHEAIHLELPIEHFLQPFSEEVYFEEEVRAFAKEIVEIVRPMRLANEPLEIELIEADNSLKACGDNPNCPGFREFLKSQQRVR